MVFVSGGPGRGKTALLTAFAQQAMEAHPDLLAAAGKCSAYAGVSDPYLPFREAMAMLTGDVEAPWLSGAITTQQARRLGWRWRWARALLAWADVCLARGERGDRQRAAELLRESQGMFEAMGISRLAAVAGGRLQSLAAV